MPSKLSIRWLALLYLAICAPLVLLLLECVRGAYCDVTMIRTAALRSEIGRLRSQAVRRAGHLEVLLEPSAAEENWDAARADARVAAYWKELKPDPPQLYSAVVEQAGAVVLHSDAAMLGKRLDRRWYDRKVSEAGEDVVRVETDGLAPGARAFDVRVPLFAEGKQVGDYHEGLDADWFEASVWSQQRDVLSRWGVALAGVLVVDALALWSLIYVTRHNARLLHLVQQGIHEQARVLSQIGGGLAHQIRNPLHALRINLHILRRSQHGQTRLSEEQLEAAFRESDAEIDTLDRLMRDLLQFAVPDAGTKSEVEISQAVIAALNLFDEEFRRKQIETKVELAQEPLAVAIDPAHLRQAIGNLLAFAQVNTPEKGQVEVTLARRGKHAELVVGHNGASLTKAQQLQIFEPFQSPRESGSGLELALVQCVALEAGGAVTCEKRVPSGNRFRVTLPLMTNVSKESLT